MKEQLMSRKYKLRWQDQCGKYAVTKKRTVMQGPVTLKGGEAGLIFYRPVFVKGQIWGFAVVVAKARQLLKESLANLDQGEYNYRLLKSPVESKKYSLLALLIFCLTVVLVLRLAHTRFLKK
jgi:sensor domain CHASE-containing protein